MAFGSELTPAEAYRENGERLGVELQFRNDPGTEPKPASGVRLLQNRPNPFTDATTLGFYLPEATKATLTILDVSGKVLRDISSDYPAGFHEVQIGKGELGAKGVYYYRLQTPGFTESRKMVLMD